MSYEKGKAYREYALIEGINLLVNMVERTRDDKESLKKIHDRWFEFNRLSFPDQIELIYGTSTNETKCKYMVHCINKLNSYMTSEYPNHKGYIRLLIKDTLSSINMAIMADIHIWKKAQIDAIQAAFRSGRVSKARPYFEPNQLEFKTKKKERYIIGKDDQE